MHICVFTTAHPWDDVRVKSKFVDSFLAAGDHVTWIGPDRSFFVLREDRDMRVDYRLVRTGRGRWGRIRSMWALRRLLSSVEDVDWVYTPDPDAALLVKSVRHPQVLLDIHEEYHKGHLTQSAPGPLLRLAEPTVRAAITAIGRSCTLVTAVNETILNAYRVPKSRRLVTLNTPPTWFGEVERGPNAASPAVRLFHGKALAGNGTHVVLQALAELRSRGVDARAVMFASAADGAPYDPRFSSLVASQDLAPLLDLRAAVPHACMPAIMRSADVGLIAYDRVLGAASLPNRFFEYLALGLVPIVPSYSPLMREIVDKYNVGLVADFENPTDVADAVEWAATHGDALSEMANRARALFQEAYSWEAIFDRLRHRMLEV